MPLPKIVSAIKLLRHGSLDLFVRSIIFGRGRRRRFGVPPTIRTVKKWVIAHPLISNCCFYGVLFTAGELSRQILSMRKEKNKKPLDFGSVQRCAVLGTVVFPPIFHQWYKWLDSRFPKGAISKKIILDQFLLGPIMVALFYIVLSLLEGQEDPLLECKEKFLTTFVCDCLYWIPVQAFNFKFVPSSLRVVYLAISTFIWFNVLCLIKSIPASDFKRAIM
ncbi:mpv17-like protein [Lepeophtheirus salmonis]|uniref:mpv17-like protein n=1 Tax=Lepeophtheirus salmonis TaxID=72036 RepID=UPI001AE64369|nr:PXMP2/4 family protein 4-like [Lepeophtheirus salmonis]